MHLRGEQKGAVKNITFLTAPENAGRDSGILAVILTAFAPCRCFFRFFCGKAEAFGCREHISAGENAKRVFLHPLRADRGARQDPMKLPVHSFPGGYFGPQISLMIASSPQPFL